MSHGKWSQVRTMVLAFLVIFAGLVERGASADDRETDPAVLANIEKFQDLKFGLFVHWGPCSQWGARIAWPLSPSQGWARPDDLPAWVERDKDFERFSRDFFDLNKTFDPKAFEPQKWAEAAGYAGMKYIIFVTKCHDGFSMFDTDQSDYCITDPSCPFHTDPKANITKSVMDAFRQEGFTTGLYFSMPDWHHHDYEDPNFPVSRLFRPNYDVTQYPAKWQRYLDFMHGQVGELMTGFGPLDILWLDGGAGDDWRMPELASMARKNQPGILIVHRGAGGRYENYRTPEQAFPDKALPYPWETCLTMGDRWAYDPDDYYKPARELIHILVDIVAKGGNLLLDIGPDADGRFPPEAMDRLQELGDWMKWNGEAIYGTRPVAPYREGRVCFTRKGDAAYLIHLAQNAQVRPPRQIVVSSIQPADGAEVTLLGKNVALEWEKRGNGAIITVPWNISHTLRGERPYCRHAWAIKINKAIVQSDNETPSAP